MGYPRHFIQRSNDVNEEPHPACRMRLLIDAAFGGGGRDYRLLGLT